MSLADPVVTIVHQVEASEASVLDLLQVYETEAYAASWHQDARLYEAFGTTLIRAGYPTRAFELLRDGCTRHATNLALQYLRALALARGGSLAKAEADLDALLPQCAANRPLQVEVLSLAGNLKKQRYARTPAEHTARKTALALAAASYYETAAQLTDDAFPGINAATMYLLSGQTPQARQLAHASAARATAALTTRPRPGAHWLYATLGEAGLILEAPQQAVEGYRQALAQAPGRGDIVAMYRNVCLLQHVVTIDPALLALFPLGQVVVFAGHMLDHPERETPRFPPEPALEHAVSQAIHQHLDRLQATVGYCSIAAGADILFAEQMLQRMRHTPQVELHIVFPFAPQDFYLTSVDGGRPERAGWRARCDRILAHPGVHVHYATTEPFLGDTVLFAFAQTVAQGLAITHAAQLGMAPQALVVQDPAPCPQQPGSIASFLRAWQGEHRTAWVINLATLRAQVQRTTQEARTPPRRTPPRVSPPPSQRQVKAMLFADVKNFSTLAEEHTPLFLTHFLTGVAERLAPWKRGHKLAFWNTWGDGLYLVFHQVVECAACALHLLDWIGQADVTAMGLPPDTTLRMGLHCGPVFPGMDHVIRRKNFFGSHVNRAARIEPVTMPGAAFTSEQFAAVLAVESRGQWLCEYVGITGLAKGYDRTPLYHLVPR